MKPARGATRMRRLNGVVSAIIAVLFLCHVTLGSFSMLTGFTGALVWVVWIGVGLIAVHVVLGVVTSKEQLDDEEQPPSTRKKRHLALKWATGCLLASLAIAHAMLPKSSYTAAFLMIALALALGAHLCVGAKSLLGDLGLPTRLKRALRIVICVVCAAAALCIAYLIL